MKKTVLVCGAGGFIGGHLVANLIKENKYNIICSDIKPFEYWFQFFDDLKNFSTDLKELDSCLKVTKKLIMFIIWHVTWGAWALLRIIKLNVCCRF